MVKKYRYNVFPKKYETSYFLRFKVNPTKYLKYMIFINLVIEKFEGKTFQVFPLQTYIGTKKYTNG